MNSEKKRTEIDDIKVKAAMRSLYRLAELQKMLSPDILIDNEKSILTRHLLGLNGAEIIFMTKNFSEYYEDQQTQAALDDEILTKNFNKYITKLN